MECKERMEEYLRDNDVPFEIMAHTQAFTMPEVAAALQVPGQQVAKVVMVKGDRVYVNRGTREGVAVGQELVVGESEVIRDPDTGEILDEEITDIALLEATKVKEKLSICSVTSGDAGAVAKGMTIHLP